MNTQIETKKLQLFSLDLQSSILAESFENLPIDRYVSSDSVYRARRYSLLRYKDKKCNVQPEPVFCQDKKINFYLGGIKRKYSPVKSNVISYLKDKVISKFVNEVLPYNNYNIGIHQIRIMVSGNTSSIVTPEGFHHDGMDYLAILPFARYNIENGCTSILDPSTNVILYSKKLLVGDVLLINDKLYKHYTSPIKARTNRKGYRDVFIFTFEIIN